MADFDTALAWVLPHEGGWADDPDDPGGATMKGITFAVAQKYGIQTKEELRNIPDETVAKIYRYGYWRFSGIQSQRVATKLFDMAVNMGVTAAVKLAQSFCGVSVDGVYGPKTEAAINAIPEDTALFDLVRVSVEKYQTIVANRPASKKFLKGWLRRAADLP